ncbi:MAG: hypothetical protein RI957_213 [Verrucomicrobiota bacterium]|jgi:periplasmic divalent cation tolerance protein
MPSLSSPLLVLCSFPDKGVARQIGTLLLEKQVAACVSFLASESMYRWQGKIESASETVMQIKTSQQHFETLCRLLQLHHPYEIPEIIGIPITEISPSYRDWLHQSLVDSPAADFG